MAKNYVNVVLGRLYPFFDIKSGDKEDTIQFKEISHENLCYAVLYWIEQNRLVLVEPINIFITQSLRDEGVDIVLDFLTSGIKIGFQIKSYNDIRDKEFTPKLKSQITTSKKHGLNKLFICLCGDLTDKSQLEKMSGISSEIDEINKTDDYMYVLSPLKMIQIYEAHEEKKHPLRYALNMGTVRKMLNSIVEALSDHPLYVPTIKFEYKLREEIDIPDSHHSFRLSLKDGAFEDDMSLFDKIREAHMTGESFRIPGDKIIELADTDNDKEFTFDPEDSFIEIKPVFPTLPPSSVYIQNEDGKRTRYYDDIVFIREKLVDGIVHLRSRNDDKLIIFRISIDTNSNAVSIGLKFNFKDSDVGQILHFFKFQNELLAEKFLVFSSEQGEMGGIPTIKEIQPIPQEWIDLFEKLVFIQDTIEKPIFLEGVPDQDLIHDILALYELLSEGETQKIMIKLEFTIKKKNLVPLIKRYKKQGFINDLKWKIKDSA